MLLTIRRRNVVEVDDERRAIVRAHGVNALGVLLVVVDRVAADEMLQGGLGNTSNNYKP